MSRVGKSPITLPKGVTLSRSGEKVIVKGPKGQLDQDVPVTFEIEEKSGAVHVKRPDDSKDSRARHGLYRALLANMVTGVTDGFGRTLEIEGVGYNAKAEGKNKIVLQVGFSHPVPMTAPEGVEVETPKPTIIVIKGADKQKVGQFAANIRRVRPPEPYKGKGIRYAGEFVRRKAGKAVGGKA